MAEQRGKEIGVRKVLGASVSSITTLLSKDFIKLVIIAYCYCITHCLVGHEQMVAGFHLSHHYYLVDFCFGSIW